MIRWNCYCWYHWFFTNSRIYQNKWGDVSPPFLFFFFFYFAKKVSRSFEPTKEQRRNKEACGRIAGKRVATNYVALIAPIIRHYAVSQTALNWLRVRCLSCFLTSSFEVYARNYALPTLEHDARRIRSFIRLSFTGEKIVAINRSFFLSMGLRARIMRTDIKMSCIFIRNLKDRIKGQHVDVCARVCLCFRDNRGMFF